MNAIKKPSKTTRDGGVAVLVAIVLLVLFGFVALAIDLGYIAMTKTSMQAAADSGALSGGTELKSSLGRAPLPAATMRSTATGIAVDYAARHANGDVDSTYLNPGAGDVRFGWAVFNTDTGAWDTNWGSELPDVGGHNLIGTVAHRNRAANATDDRPLPLIFARVLGNDLSNLETLASAVIMPAKGVRITPGSDEITNLMPFVLHRRLWEKYLAAQDYYELNPNVFSAPDLAGVEHDDFPGEPLFGHMVEGKKGVLEFVQDFADVYDCGCGFQDPISSVGDASGGISDGVLEVDLFPRDNYTSGNFGTIDLGSSNNSTADLSRQILYGVNADDLSHFPNNQIVIPENSTIDLEGDTGISAGIKDELASIIGDCRTIFLFEKNAGPGNNAIFTVSAMAGIRIMDVKLTGALRYKKLDIQLCEATLPGGIGDIDEQIGADTTVFTPLILIE